MRVWDKRVSIIIAMGSLVFASLVSADPADVTNVHVERYASGRYSFAVTVRLPETVQIVTVRARCSIDGFVGKKVDVVLPTH